MKKILLFSFLMLALGSLGVVRAQNFDGERIKSFFSEITVNKDNSVKVKETIVFNTGGVDRHGILRDIKMISAEGRKMEINNVEVVDDRGSPYVWSQSEENGYLKLKIGDPNITFNGEKTYVISYLATKAVSQYEDFDEIYWNVTGNEWQQPIEKSSARVFLPEGASLISSACYEGGQGQKKTCILAEGTNFSSSPLHLYEGLTVAVSFPKGFMEEYSGLDKFSIFFDKYGAWMLAGVLPLLTLMLGLWYWYKNGRDPKGRGVIIPQYDVPNKLSPLEIVGILEQKTSPGDISSEIIYLATEGYLKINQIEEKTFGVFKSTDYELVKTKDFSNLSKSFDRKLLSELLGSKDRVKLSALKNKFYTVPPQINTLVMKSLLEGGYYKNLGKTMSGKLMGIMSSVWMLVFFANAFLSKNIPELVIGTALAVIVYIILSIFFPAKTEKGVAIKEYILGLKDYLRIAEKDRLEFHNAPEKKPEVFEKLLPYAMALGVADVWAKEFKDIYITPPSWYSGAQAASFNAVAFNNSLSNFGSFTTSSLSSSPRGSGSGGGGFSGGGGGGGGGGSW